MTVVAVIGLLASMALANYNSTLRQAKITKAIGDIRTMQIELQTIEANGDTLPSTLATIGRDRLLDPWGNPYQYNPFPPDRRVPPGARRDRFLVPINSTFDLYSMGEDGQSVAPLNASRSQDDIIRANDGGFIGLASRF